MDHDELDNSFKENYTIEERLVSAVWVHERDYLHKSMSKLDCFFCILII